MPNPLNFVTSQDIVDLGLSPEEIVDAYQPSEGGIYHTRGAEGMGKTLYLAHYYRYLIDSGQFTPFDATGNMSFKGKYARGYTVRRGKALRDYLWDMTHIPYTHKIVIIDEIDSEFPARMFTSKEQTELALRMWHIHKVGNIILMSSHIGNSTDLIFHQASHYIILPKRPNFEKNQLDYDWIDNLKCITLTDLFCKDIIKTMLIYRRKELTEDMSAERQKTRYSKQKKTQARLEETAEPELELDRELEF